MVSSNKIPPIELKRLSGVENLQPEQVREILEKSVDWIGHFYERSSGDRKVTCNFFVEGLNYGGVFDLSTAADIEKGIAPVEGRVPYLFLSDLLNFIEQIRTSLTTNRRVPLNQEQIVELDRLGNIFDWIKVSPRNNKITIDDLERIENEQLTDTIIRRVELIKLILAPSIGISVEGKLVKKEEEAEAVSRGSAGGGAFPFPMGEKGDSEPSQDQGGDTQQQEPEEPKKPDHQPSTPLKISELSPEKKLYLQSLSIITINQALNRYFSDAALQDLGLPPGSRVTFDQLPLGVRQQLMDRAFLQVETMLLSGRFNLNDLISQPGTRVDFTSQTGLNLLIDVHGMKLINQAVHEIVVKQENSPIAANIKKNEQEQLKAEQLSERVRNKDQADKKVENTTSTAQAEAIIQDTSKRGDEFARAIESELNIISVENGEKYLDEAFLKNLEVIIGRRDPVSSARIVANARSLVEVYIQQGLPPEYLIPDAKRFDYSKFRNLFGNELSPAEFEKNKEEIANLIIFYWKRKRAIWFREIRQEFGQEKYTPEEAIALAKQNNPARAAKHIELRRLNFDQGGRNVAEALADPNSPAAKGNAILSDFVQLQQDLIAKKLEAEIAKMNPDGQQQTLKAYFEFYMPGVVVQQYNIQIFRTEIVPKMSPMDYYLINANHATEPGAFAKNGDGFMQRAFTGAQDGGSGDDLLNNDLSRQALKWGLRAGIGAATSGASEAAFAQWEAMKAADPTGMLAQVENELLSRIIELFRKYWPYILGALITALLASIAPLLLFLLPLGYLGFRFLPQIQPLLPGGIEAAQRIAAESTAIGQDGLRRARLELGNDGIAATQGIGGGGELTQNIASSTLITAGQAVVATVTGASVFVFLYQASLNSAFLTDFPTNESEYISNIEKTSKYAEMTKTAEIVGGCISPENNGSKCENPIFPLSIRYTVTITPKEDFSIQITSIKDTIRFNQSEKGWENMGQTPPVISEVTFLGFPYFIELIGEQNGGNSPPLNTPVPTIPAGTDIIDSEATPTSPPPGAIVIKAGESLTFSYELRELNSDYRHTAITNTIEVDFYAQNDFTSATDNIITGARVCLGECGGDAGCWPITGTLTQMPYDSDYSHGKNPKNKYWHDAYDIGTGKGPALYGNNVYVPFDGELCFVRCSGQNEGFGCYFALSFSDGGQQNKLIFAHFQDPHPNISTPGSCMQVEAGFLIGQSGTRGTSTNNHLHYGASHGGDVFGMPNDPGFTIIETLVPEDNDGNHPPVEGKGVTTCYE